MKSFNVGLQESLVAMLCYDAAPQGAKAAAALLPAKTFDPYFRELAEAAVEYLSQYGKPPGDHTYDIIESLKSKRPDDAPVWDKIFSSLKRTKDVINPKYTLDRASIFARRQAAKVAIQKAMPLLLKDDDYAVDEAEAILAGVGKRSLDLSSPGTLLNDPHQAIAFLDQMEDEAMPTGIKELDRFGLGPIRGGLWMLVAPTNAGKTQMAVQKGKTGIIHGKRVLHVTLEMRETKVAQRYCQSLFAISKRQANDIIARRFKLDDLGRFVGFDEYALKDRPSLDDPDIRPFLLKRLAPLRRRARLIIKQFPTGQLTLRQLNAYLDRLEATMRFIPDLVIVDYPDLMQIESKHYRHDLDNIYKGLRGIAGERNFAMAVYSQSNKLGLNSKTMGLGKAAEDWRKEATVDTLITYNQTKAEYQLGLARLFVAKAREDVKNFTILLSQLYAVGQFSIDSCRMIESSYWPMIERGDEVDDE